MQSSSANATVLPSHAFITKEDMKGDVITSANANRLKGYCSYRGGLMAPLPGLPHATGVRFQAADNRPEDLYVHDEAELKQYSRWPATWDRMIRRSAPLDEILIYVDGSCLDQHISGDATQGKAGCAVVFKPEPKPDPSSHQSRGFGFRLESRGPTGEVHPQTSNRAELRAALAALEARHWIGEGRIQLTIASDSAYLVQGITEYIGTWRQREWRNSAGNPIANRDLWEKLLSRVNLHAHRGCEIRFWLIPRAQNTIADSMAKHAAENRKMSDHYSGIMVVAT